MPSEFGQYQLIEKIAQGGMAEIFRGKALDAQGIEKPVVIKRILPQIAASPEFVEMLVDEAKIAVMLSHGNIAQIYDLGKVADDYFIVMEYVDGKTLSQVMKRLRTLNKRMPIAYALWIAGEVANGLDYMHRKNDDRGNPLHIIHRDISPQNIILSTSGTVKIIDFGIAKAKTKVSTTDSGVLKGKFAYMSPEHAEGEKLDDRTDIFSLGIILFELLTGERLFKGKNNQETIRKVKRAKVSPPSSSRDQVTGELDQIALKALKKNREERYQNAEEFHRALTRTLVTDYPQFSPRELVPYLGELFPEIAVRIPEEGPPVATESQRETGVSSEPHEGTALADSDLVQKHLGEEEIAPPEIPEEKTTSLRFRPILKFASLSASLIVFLWLGARFGPPWVESVARRKAEKTAATPVLPVPPALPEAAVTRPQATPAAPTASVAPASAALSLNSEPPGAAIFLNDLKTPWRTPASLSLAAGKETKVGLHLDRYRFWEGRFQLDPGKTVTLSVPLELNYGDLEINSLPTEAEVYLDGRRVGKTPYRLSQVPPETPYEVVLKHPGYEDWRRQVKVFGGKSEVVDATLKKLPKAKSLP